MGGKMRILGLVIGGTWKDNWALGWMSAIEYKIFKVFFFRLLTTDE